MIVGFVYDKETGEIREWHTTSRSTRVDFQSLTEDDVRQSIDPRLAETSDVVLIEMDNLPWKRLVSAGHHGFRINPDTRAYEPRAIPKQLRELFQRMPKRKE